MAAEVKSIELVDTWEFKGVDERNNILTYTGYKFRIDGESYIHTTKDNHAYIDETKPVYMSVWENNGELHFAVWNHPYSYAEKYYLLAGDVLKYYFDTCYNS